MKWRKHLSQKLTPRITWPENITFQRTELNGPNQQVVTNLLVNLGIGIVNCC